MTLYEISESDEPDFHFVKVADTPVGKGMFSCRAYPATAIVGRIAGNLKQWCDHSSAYCFEFDDVNVLEPFAPFRYLNHSCDPNCEFEMLESPAPDGEGIQVDLYLIALRDLKPDEELTIAYNWPADSAIECKCNSPDCVGWVVCPTELDIICTISEFTNRHEVDQYEVALEDADQVEATEHEKTPEAICLEGC